MQRTALADLDRVEGLTVARIEAQRMDAMLETLPIGVLHFHGMGIQDNLADKAKKLGTLVWKFSGA